jgi:hypothetical protein
MDGGERGGGPRGERGGCWGTCCATLAPSARWLRGRLFGIVQVIITVVPWPVPASSGGFVVPRVLLTPGIGWRLFNLVRNIGLLWKLCQDPRLSDAQLVSDCDWQGAMVRFEVLL